MIGAETAALSYGVIAPSRFLHRFYKETPLSSAFLTAFAATPSARGAPESSRWLCVETGEQLPPPVPPTLSGRKMAPGRSRRTAV